MKAVSRGQVLEVTAGLGNGTLIDWDQLDGDELQAKVISLSPEERGRRMTAFLKNGMRFSLGGLKVATAPFDPAKFIGKGWTFWKGSKDGNGLEGEEVRDKASLALAEVDFAKAEFLSCLEKTENSITGEDKLVRLSKLGRVIYGTTVGAGLWADYQSCENKAESVLEKLYQQFGITYVDFPGDILRSPRGSRCVLCLYRNDDGLWYWGCEWLGNDWRGHIFLAVSQQVSSEKSSGL